MGDPRKLLIGADAATNLADVVAGLGASARQEKSAAGLEAIPGARAIFDEEILRAIPSAIASLRAADRGDGVLVAPEDRIGSLLQSFLAEHGQADFSRLEAEGKMRESADGALEAVFDRQDVAGRRRLVLMSHHPPFSQYDSGGAKLVNKLGDLLESGRVLAWYWGHEHRCVLYDHFEPWKMWGRCVGHGGYPAFRDRFSGAPERTNADGSAWRRVKRNTWPAALVLDGENRYVPRHAAHYAPNGFVSLQLEGPKIHETVRAPDGTILLESTIGP